MYELINIYYTQGYVLFGLALCRLRCPGFKKKSSSILAKDSLLGKTLFKIFFCAGWDLRLWCPHTWLILWIGHLMNYLSISLPDPARKITCINYRSFDERAFCLDLDVNYPDALNCKAATCGHVEVLSKFCVQPLCLFSIVRHLSINAECIGLGHLVSRKP